MKKLLIAFTFILSFNTFVLGQSQKVLSLITEIEGQWKVDEDNNLIYQQVVEMPGIDKDVLFQRAENYFIYNYKSGKDVIQTKDKEQGLIIGKGLYSNIYLGNMFFIGNLTYNAYHLLRIDIKEEKARITLTVQQYNIDVQSAHGANLNSNYNQLLSQTYPINTESKTKTNEGYAFYFLHLKCTSSISQLINELKNGNSKSAPDTNW